MLKEIINGCEKCRPLGINFDDIRRENLNHAYQYKPKKVKVLWILESPPLSNPPRYFYRPELTRYDGLFREMMKVLGIAVSNPKDDSLKMFADMGHFLIDSTKCPADKQNSHLKPQMLYNCSPILAKEIQEIDPEKIIIIKSDIYRLVYKTVQKVGMEDRILNVSAIPFPSSGQQKRFREKVRQILSLSYPTIEKEIQIPKIHNTMSNYIVVNNITDADLAKNQLRITIDNKHLFPAERISEPKVYEVAMIYNGNLYSCSYRIGSKDGRSRSGVLRLGSYLVSKMNFGENDVVTITQLSAGKYEIRKR